MRWEGRLTLKWTLWSDIQFLGGKIRGQQQEEGGRVNRKKGEKKRCWQDPTRCSRIAWNPLNFSPLFFATLQNCSNDIRYCTYRILYTSSQFNWGDADLSLSRLICVSQGGRVCLSYRTGRIHTGMGWEQRKSQMLFVIFIWKGVNFFWVSLWGFFTIFLFFFSLYVYTFIYCVDNRRFHVFFFGLLAPSYGAIFLETVVYTHSDENHLL